MFSKTPLILLLIGLFHLFWTGRVLADYWDQPFPSLIWLQALWIVVYTLCWVGVCALKRTAVHAYFLVTLLNLVLRLFVLDPIETTLLADTLFPVDMAFCLILLLLYKRIQS